MVGFLLSVLLWAIAFVSICLYHSSSHEVIKVLAIFVAAICTIWGFASTHWGFHLLCLLILVRYRFRFRLQPIPVDDC